MFFEALQSYCAPMLTIMIFIAVISRDTLFDNRVRGLFLAESIIVIVLMVATWADRCLSVADLGGVAWRFRTVTTFINFAASPALPLCLMLIYNKKSIIKQMAYFLPLLLNFVFCVASIFDGLIFSISPENVYTRGPLFFVPFVISGFYLVTMIVLSARQNNNMVNRREETLVLTYIMIAVTIASVLEIIFVKRFMLYSTAVICLILYFTVLSRQKIKYDDLTGTYSRAVYSKRIETLPGKHDCTIAIIDIDGLKHINDTYGHAQGDVAIFNIANTILKVAGRSMQLYRIGGDEFVLIAVKHSVMGVETVLKKANSLLAEFPSMPLSFSYGAAFLSRNGNFVDIRNLADKKLYEHKIEHKKLEAAAEN